LWRWPSSQEMGQALFETLFRSQEQCDRVLQVFFESELARPIRYPVRVRLQTDASVLADLPWATMSWEENSLRDNGWTFELSWLKRSASASPVAQVGRVSCCSSTGGCVAAPRPPASVLRISKPGWRSAVSSSVRSAPEMSAWYPASPWKSP